MKKWIQFAVLALLAVPAWGTESLRIGVLLIEDSVPLYVAQQEGFYADAKLEVDLVPFLSALERDSALAAGALDGAIADPVGAILFDKGQGRLKITSLCLGEKPGEGVFALLASPNSGIRTVEELKHVEIAVSTATIIEYVTDRMLEQYGFAPGEIRKIEVKKMPIRMQMLLADSVKAATLPEPLASIAAGKGARVLVTDAEAENSLSQTVIVFRSAVLRDRKKEVAGFFHAYGKAVQAMNSQPENYRQLFVEKGRIPPFLAKTYPIPTYPLPKPFDAELYQAVIDWLAAKQLVEPIPYQSIVATDFLEQQY